MTVWVTIPICKLSSIINTNQLHTLGISDRYLYTLLGFFSILLCFWLIRPLVKFMILLHWADLLTYLIGGIFLLSVLLLAFQAEDGMRGEEQGVQLSFLLLGFVFFGGFLFIVKLFKTLAGIQKKQARQ
ncbi:hypothetical protein [Virgibacillus senegalensis]|uniref:hypothetical protein n=1 Tax=Virgibacillus senegalensis TaxID=1499679 RepID=UPI00069D9876|nr:hypothetical protein [Virgibacillus senegalensis]